MGGEDGIGGYEWLCIFVGQVGSSVYEQLFGYVYLVVVVGEFFGEDVQIGVFVKVCCYVDDVWFYVCQFGKCVVEWCWVCCLIFICNGGNYCGGFQFGFVDDGVVYVVFLVFSVCSVSCYLCVLMWMK